MKPPSMHRGVRAPSMPPAAVSRLALVLTLFLFHPVAAQAVCPNGIIEPPETCDDGNASPGDGCSPLCMLEVPNRPPVCDAAVPGTDTLWPPNHELVPIQIDGVTDPDGDPVIITVTGVAQDEPVDDTGDGSTCPDAVAVGVDVVALRSERSGGGDGRVYHVAFRADDPHGGACVGAVEVCVPHDHGGGATCGDQGPLFDSTVGVCGPGNGCDLNLCLPPPPFVFDSCSDVTMPHAIVRRLRRTRRLLEHGVVAPSSRRQVHLARRAIRQLSQVDHLVARRLGGACQIELHDMVERATRCAACPLD